MNPHDAPLRPVVTLPGAVALSPFRVEKLLASLDPRLGAAIELDTRFIHFVSCNAALDAAEMRVLQRLLVYGTAAKGEPK